MCNAVLPIIINNGLKPILQNDKPFSEILNIEPRNLNIR